MQCGISDCKSVRPSLCLSVKRVNCDKRNENTPHIVIPYERSMQLVLQHEEYGWWRYPFDLRFRTKLTQLLQKRRLPNNIRS